MKKSIATVLTLASMLSFPGAQAFADFTGPGKNAAYASADGGSLPAAGAAVAATSITAGKSKRVLEIQGTFMATNPVGMLSPAVWVEVNGVAVPPTDDFSNALAAYCQYNCTVSGTWWLDLDAAEAAAPGTIYNQPLQVVLYAMDYLATGPAYSTSLAVKMVKK